MNPSLTPIVQVQPTIEGRPRGQLRLPGRVVLPPPLRRLLRRKVLKVLSHDGAAPDYDAPRGDPGLFGPDSMVWKIHADFPAMMAGGLAALMLQALHPLALAGVWDHSDFRDNTLARLRNTIAFVARTTYAPRAPAEAAIQRVLRIHSTVNGVAPDGRHYSANDPRLLTWVHCAEAWCFLHAYELYCHVGVPRAMQDRYLEESALIPEALGAQDVPKSLARLEAYFREMQVELACNARTGEALRILQAVRLPLPLSGFSRGLFFGAGAAVLPGWALKLMDRSHIARLRDRAAAGCLQLIAPSIRTAMAEGGLAWRACARTGTDYEALFRWP